MRVSTHILPRRLILAMLLAGGAGLRLWGLGWGPDEAGALHPGEWAWQIIDGLSLSNPTYPGVWTQVFFSLAALVREVLWLIQAGLTLLTGEVRLAAEVVVSARWAGRFTVAMLGSAQIILVYLVGRRYFDSVATGLLAAALVAVSPLLVAQSHFLSLDIPLGLMILVCLAMAWSLAERGGTLVCALCGLTLGLTVTTRASGLLAFPIFLAAYFLAVRNARPARSRSLWIWPLAGLVGLVAGLFLGCPSFIFDATQAGDLVASSVTWPPVSSEQWWEFAGLRLRSALPSLAASVGPVVLLLWLIGAAILVWRRQWERLILLIFPPLYFAAGLIFLKSSLEGLFAVWYPVAAVVAVWPLVLLCRRLPTRRWQVAAAAFLAVLLCIWPLWRSLGVGYLFWQEDTLATARRWVNENLPPGSRLFVGPSIPLGVFSPTRPWLPGKSLEEIKADQGYLVVQPDPLLWVGGQASPAAAPAQEETTPGLQLLKRFDLKSAWAGAGRALGDEFLRWLSPNLELLAWPSPRPVRQPLALIRPPVGVERPYGVAYAGQEAYSRDEGVMLVRRNRPTRRVVVAERPLKRLGLWLRNLGDDLAVVRVRQTPLSSQVVSLYPGQSTRMVLPARNWPPMMGACYPVGLKLDRGDRLLARLTWDPLVLGRQALEGEDLVLASAILEPVAQRGGGAFDALAMLADAWARLGRFEPAKILLDSLSEVEGGAAARYRELALDQVTDAAWWERLAAFTGYHPQLLKQATTRSYRVAGAWGLAPGDKTTFAGPGFHGAWQPAGQGGDERLHIWLEDIFPAGRLRLEMATALGGELPAGEHLLEVAVWGHGPEGSRQVGRASFSGADLASGRVGMELDSPAYGARLELRLVMHPPRRLALREVKVGLDLGGHLRHVLRWYLDASGRVAQAAGRYPEAVDYFGALLELDPGFRSAYIPLARALLDTGKSDAAYQHARKAEALFASLPDRLAEVRELYRSMERPEDVARVEQRLGHLRPSLGREVRFAGGVTLLGYDLAANQVQRGKGLDVSYYWRCWSPPPLNYYVFVHLRGQGQLYTFDHLLDHGRRNLTKLAVGEVVREDYTLDIPADAPPGKYRLVVGLWDPHFTGQGVPIIAGPGKGQEEVQLAEIEVR